MSTAELVNDTGRGILFLNWSRMHPDYLVYEVVGYT